MALLSIAWHYLVLLGTAQYCSALLSTARHRSTHCSAHYLALLGTDQHCSTLIGTAWHCSALLGTAWHCLPLLGTAQHCTVVLNTARSSLGHCVPSLCDHLAIAQYYSAPLAFLDTACISCYRWHFSLPLVFFATAWHHLKIRYYLWSIFDEWLLYSVNSFQIFLCISKSISHYNVIFVMVRKNILINFVIYV